MTADAIAIVDCHAHFLDAKLNTYPIFERRSPGFEALVGDYSSLPRRYLPEDYLKDANGLNVVQTIWAEFMSVDPVSVDVQRNSLRDAAHRDGDNRLSLLNCEQARTV